MSRELREEARGREAEKKRNDLRQEQFHADLRHLAGQAEGKRVLRWLIAQGGIFAEDFQPGPLGAYRAGLRATALRLWRLLETNLPADLFAAIVLNAGPEPVAERADPDEDEPRYWY